MSRRQSELRQWYPEVIEKALCVHLCPVGKRLYCSGLTERLALSDAHFQRISKMIYQRAGIVLADHKRDMVYNRLVRRLRFAGTDGFRSLLELAGI
ncbi:hypothetical protein ACLB1R_06810 [Escherichia coli]